MLKQKWRVGEVSRETITDIAGIAEAPGDHHEWSPQRRPSAVHCIGHFNTSRVGPVTASLSPGLLDLYSVGTDQFWIWKRRGVGRSSPAEECNPYWLEDAIGWELRRVELSQHPTSPRGSSTRKTSLGQSIVLLGCRFGSMDNSRARTVQ